MATIKIEHDFVECKDGKEREIFPFPIKDKDKVRHFAMNFNTDVMAMVILTPDLDKINKNTDVKAEDLFSDKPYNALMELLILAFGEKYTEDEILSWIDESTIPAIIESFFMVSGVKKKMNPTMLANGMN